MPVNLNSKKIMSLQPSLPLATECVDESILIVAGNRVVLPMGKCEEKVTLLLLGGAIT